MTDPGTYPAIDHVIYAVADLAAAATRLAERYGLTVATGGTHERLGTANRIVPLSEAYLELVTVVDPERAATNPFGRAVAAAADGQALGWVVRVNDLEAAAARIGLAVQRLSRRLPAGDELSWRMAGLGEAVDGRGLPAFIDWGVRPPPPLVGPVRHPAGPVSLRRLVVRAEPEQLRAWLGGVDLPVRADPGSPAVVIAVLAGPGGEVEADLAP